MKHFTHSFKTLLWLSALFMAVLTTACGGGDQGRAPILGLPSATLQTMSITPANSSIAINGIQQYVATASYADGSAKVVTADSSWTSSAVTNASIVSNSGLAKGLVAGVSTISASYGGQVATAVLTIQPTTLTSIALTPTSASVAIGNTQAFHVIGTYSDGSTSDISTIATFSSGTPSVAGVAVTGIATGVAVGTSVISATVNSFTASSNLNVTPAIVVSLTLTPQNPSMAIGESLILSTTAKYSDATTVNVTSSTVYLASTPTIASIANGTGLINAISAGSTAVSSTFQGVTASTNVTVRAAILNAILVTPASSNIAIGANQSYVATGSFSDGTTAVITAGVVWSIDNNTIASILPNGSALGLSAGGATISATGNGKTGTALLTVLPPPTVSSISVTPNNPSVPVGSIQQFSAIATYSDASIVNISNTVTWSSSNATSATISNSLPKGSASALAIGSTTITANLGSITGNATLTVTAPVAATINLGAATNFGALAGNSITNNSGGLTLITGDVGSPSQTVDPIQTAGFANYKSGINLTNALEALQVAITDANSRSCDVNSASGIDLGGLTLPPGVYCYAGSITLTGTFNMNGPGLYIFRTSSTLNTTANSIAAVIGGASSESVFWVPTAPTTLGANSAFVGTIMASSAAITMGDMATLQNGRVLSASALTLRNNVITK